MYGCMGTERQPQAPKSAEAIRNRVRELRYCEAAELRPNPRNWRTHPAQQSNALKELLGQVGIAGALLAYDSKRAGGLTLIDGHLRRETGNGTKWPVLVLDVDDAEADLLLAAFDPLSAMAGSAAEKLDELLRDVKPAGEALQNMLDGALIDADGAAIGTLPEDDQKARDRLPMLTVVFRSEQDKAAVEDWLSAMDCDGDFGARLLWASKNR